ncbi:hypothetical protein F0562_011763 [Nyssa sinensis]|uniref:Uncharacterized protein n=1 Tax=Nyssa sinensis TaxID=561372 RepID=A0A5J4ZTB1_9ASTE|nr:hypothetical protein F0562_011763 [Nyssa sinensis]
MSALSSNADTVASARLSPSPILQFHQRHRPSKVVARLTSHSTDPLTVGIFTTTSSVFHSISFQICFFCAGCTNGI